MQKDNYFVMFKELKESAASFDAFKSTFGSNDFFDKAAPISIQGPAEANLLLS